VAVLTGSFMLGAGLGGGVMKQRSRLPGIGSIHFSLMAFFIFFTSILLIHQQRPLSIAIAQALFLVLEGGLGFLTGAAFVIACGEMGEGDRVAPQLYAFDLMGGAVGAALYAGIMLPLLGLPLASALLACVNAIALLTVGIIRR
jgi:hypothetical protein